MLYDTVLCGALEFLISLAIRQNFNFSILTTFETYSELVKASRLGPLVLAIRVRILAKPSCQWEM